MTRSVDASLLYILSEHVLKSFFLGGEFSLNHEILHRPKDIGKTRSGPQAELNQVFAGEELRSGKPLLQTREIPKPAQTKLVDRKVPIASQRLGAMKLQKFRETRFGDPAHEPGIPHLKRIPKARQILGDGLNSMRLIF